ncbi:MAG: 30S ribosomal protein S8 [Candidatus Parcubacteria bacterium]|nr:30S ribosomal protein S8 [Candidatus Parcubacteria bacterium]MCX6738619.1 30S ribosomal protein S8 [Candidatus Parcubacteria bacterium]
MVTDPIGDMLAQIRNAGAVHKSTIVLPYSKLRYAVATALVKYGYIESVAKKGKKVVKTMEIGLLYTADGKHRISGADRLSKPSRRMYFAVTDIKPIRHGYGTLVLSTPTGILSGNEARKIKVGGEALFKIW